VAEQQMQYSADKATAYRELVAEIGSVVAGETSRTARYATAVSLLKAAFGERFFWCGFYEVDPRKQRELVVGPYQGTLGCLRIQRGVIDQAGLEAIDQEVRAEVERAIQFADASPEPQPGALYDDVYAQPYGPFRRSGA